MLFPHTSQALEKAKEEDEKSSYVWKLLAKLPDRSSSACNYGLG